MVDVVVVGAIVVVVVVVVTEGIAPASGKRLTVVELSPS
jgi:hypothetical protein